MTEMTGEEQPPEETTPEEAETQLSDLDKEDLIGIIQSQHAAMEQQSAMSAPTGPTYFELSLYNVGTFKLQAQETPISELAIVAESFMKNTGTMTKVKSPENHTHIQMAKKIQTSNKGAVVERKAINYLKDLGYVIHRAVRTGYKRGNMWFSQSNDVFGCIDIIAKKPGERTRWIQVTAHSGIGQKKADLDEIPWDPVYDSVEIWRWVGGKNGKLHKRTGELLPDLYFQVYHLDKDYALIKEDIISLRQEDLE